MPSDTLTRLIKGLRRFFSRTPTHTLWEIESNGTEDVYKIKLIKPMPEELTGIAFDAVNSLRSALAQAGHAIAVAAGKSGKNAHFPFGDSLDNVNSLRRSWIEEHSPGKCLISWSRLNHTKEGNNALWALNQLCNSHKHGVILPVAVYVGASTLDYGNFEHISWRFPLVTPVWDAAKNEMALLRTFMGPIPSCTVKVSTFIA